MKPYLKFFGAILFQCILCISSNAQQCSNDSLRNYPSRNLSYVGPGFIDSIIRPCISSGKYSELVIPFATYNQVARSLILNDSSTVPVPPIFSIQVASITKLPSGLCCFMWPTSQVISGSKVGILVIKGATSVAAGTYPINVSLNLDTQGCGTYTYSGMLPFNYSALIRQVVLKVMDSSNNCPTDTYKTIPSPTKYARI